MTVAYPASVAAPEKYDTRMSDAEGLMWRLEKDPYLSSTFSTLTILDQPPDLDVLRTRMERATWVVPRLRQRVQPSPVNLQAPLWVADPDFDIEYHVRRIALAEPGTPRQLYDLATLVNIDPFDRTRPLWQFVVVNGLKGGRAALITKMHHTITDGENGIRMSLEFTDFERHAPPRPPVDHDVIDETPEADHASIAAGMVTMRALVAGGLRLPIGVVRQVRHLLADPAQIPDASQAALDTVKGIVTQLSEMDQSRSPLWTHRSLRRRFETVRAPLGATKQAATRLGGTLNTALLTATADAAGAYHRDLGAPVEHLRASMVISTRGKDSGANAFTLARLLVPTGEMPIAERFQIIAEATTKAREGSASASVETLAVVASGLPTSLLTRVVRQQAQTVDFATSNVRGAPIPMFIGGAKVLQNYPLGPLSGVAFNLTLLSYMDSMDMGVNIDAAAVEHPTKLRTHLKEAFKRLRSA